MKHVFEGVCMKREREKQVTILEISLKSLLPPGMGAYRWGMKKRVQVLLVPTGSWRGSWITHGHISPGLASAPPLPFLSFISGQTALIEEEGLEWS